MTVCDEACRQPPSTAGDLTHDADHRPPNRTRPSVRSRQAGPNETERGHSADSAAGPRVALVSLHTSPAAAPGGGDAGGMNVYLSHAARGLAALGWQVDVYTRASSPEQVARAGEPLGAATLRYVKAGPAEPVDKAVLPAFADEFAHAMALGPRADVVHSHYWMSGLAGAVVAQAWDAPHVQSLHTVAAMKNRSLARQDPPEGAERLAGERRLARSASMVVTVSEAERAAIIADYGVPANRLAVVSPGLDGAVFHPGPGPDLTALPEALRRPAGYLLMAGRVQPIKGQDLAVQALAAMPANDRPALLVVGAPSEGHLEYAMELRRLARDLGVAQDVVFLGQQAPGCLADLMRGARLALMPSRSETFGLIAAEAGACGTPVVAADTTGLRSSVADGVTGVLLASRSPENWAARIVRLLGDPELTRRLGDAGAKLGRSRTWTRVATALETVYASLGA
ncbi:MAG: glycosyltransferase, partial [Bifidobacteriaceae bacterium]|nr:glycosyltransferase [Bifidobacteriaceae bacterium]